MRITKIEIEKRTETFNRIIVHVRKRFLLIPYNRRYFTSKIRTKLPRIFTDEDERQVNSRLTVKLTKLYDRYLKCGGKLINIK